MIKGEHKINDWYRSKVDRIGRIDGIFIEKLATRSATIHINPADLVYYSNQVMTIVSVILLSNWCNNIHIVLERDQPSVVPGFIGKSMKSIIEDLIVANDDKVEFHFYTKLEHETDINLMIGAPPIDIKNSVWMESNAWIAGHGNSYNTYQKLSKTTDFNPVGPIFSACLAQASLFRIILNLEDETSFNKWFSLYDFQQSDFDPQLLISPALSQDINLGKIFQIGCGAVGSSFDFILSLTKIKGNIALIDYDSVDPSNLISSLLFVKKDALDRIKKIDACKSLLDKTSCKPLPFNGDYTGFISSINYSDNYPDLILCFANEHNVWSTIQNNYPPIVLHATTTPNWGLNFGRHIPLKEWCIVCRFGVNQFSSTPVCAEGEIQADIKDEIPKLGVLPFLSSASATLVFAELLKLNMAAGKDPDNFIQLGMKSSHNLTFQSLQMPKKTDCAICSIQYEDIYTLYIKKSKYA
jgi:hypothetical protein